MVYHFVVFFGGQPGSSSSQWLPVVLPPKTTSASHHPKTSLGTLFAQSPFFCPCYHQPVVEECFSQDEPSAIVGDPNFDAGHSDQQIAMQAASELHKNVEQNCVGSVQQCADELLSYKHEYHRMMKVSGGRGR